MASLKADQNFSDTNHLRFSDATRKNSRLTGNPALPNPIDNGNQVQNFTTHDVRIQHDYTFGPTLLNQLILGYNRTNSYNVAVAASEGKNFDSMLGIQGIPESSPLFPVLACPRLRRQRHHRYRHRHGQRHPRQRPAPER